MRRFNPAANICGRKASLKRRGDDSNESKPQSSFHGTSNRSSALWLHAADPVADCVCSIQAFRNFDALVGAEFCNGTQTPNVRHTMHSTGITATSPTGLGGSSLAGIEALHHDESFARLGKMTVSGKSDARDGPAFFWLMSCCKKILISMSLNIWR